MLKNYPGSGFEINVKFAKYYHETISQFKHYSYRNDFLGRESTPEKIEYLKGAMIYGQLTPSLLKILFHFP